MSMTLRKFMGAGEGKAPASDFEVSLGNGRVLHYRPAATRNVTLQDPTSDIFFMAGGPYHIIINDATSPSNTLVVKTPAGDTLETLAADEVGFFSIYENSSGVRFWSSMKYPRLLP